MKPTVEELIEAVTQLASFPEVALKIDALVSKDCDVAEIGEIIETDTALSAALLRIANSAIYNVGGEIDSVDHALMRVGLREVREVVFGICATATFEGIPNELITVKDFWIHSLHCASASEHLAKIGKIRTSDSLFTAGLLHDIGQLVLFNQCPELSRTALSKSLNDNDSLTPYISEQEVFGYDHAEVGAALATAWNFPPTLIENIRWHHQPFADGVTSESVPLVHLGNSVAVMAELDSTDPEEVPPIDPRAAELVGLTDDMITDTIAVTQQSVGELLQLFVR